MTDKNHITTYTKAHFDPVQAREQDICIEDIAHALSLLCRANGHIRQFYSVAQHCIHCAMEAKAQGLPGRVQLHCLLHDAAEAYIGDITRPLKRHLKAYVEAEDALQAVILRALHVPALTEEEQAAIHSIDDRLLYHEFLTYHGDHVWDEAPRLHITLPAEEVSHAQVEQEFLALYDRLAGTQTDAVHV